MRQQTIAQWLKSLPIPWLVSGPNGSLDVGSYGAVLDTQTDLLDAATKARMPSKAPADALAHIGSDRQLVQGPGETNASFITRLKAAWTDWPRAGTPLELLLQLYYQGFSGLTIVQQNGLYYQLTTPPNADPFTSLVSGNTGLAGVIQESSLYPYTRTIPVSTPWWYFSPNTDLSSRYAILVPGVATSRYIVTVNFDGVQDGTVAHPWPVVTWPHAFSDATYRIMVGPPVLASGAPPLSVYADGTTKAAASVSIGASGPWVGTVDVMGYVAGTDPLNPSGALNIGLMCNIIKTWGPAKASCVAIAVLNSGQYIGWPVRAINAAGAASGSVTTYDINGRVI